jgi:hypothetical protein
LGSIRNCRLGDLRWVRTLCVAACAGPFVAACSPEPEAAEDALLFGAAVEGLSVTEVKELETLFAELFPRSGDGARFEDPNCGDVEPAAELVDLDADGANEVFVQWGNACTSGMTGRSLSLFVKDDAERWRAELGFPAFGYRVLASRSGGYPDLELGGPGFCFEVWTRAAEGYEFKCNLPQEEGGCDGVDNVCPDG